MGKCDCIVAYNGHPDFIDSSLLKSDIDKEVEYEKSEFEDWINMMSLRTDSIYKDRVSFYKNATAKDLLSEKRTISKYCPECGEKIDWSKYEERLNNGL